MVTANGKGYADAVGMTLAAFLQREGYDASRVVVERNLQIVPKGEYGKVILQGEDILEIVHFVGGG